VTVVRRVPSPRDGRCVGWGKGDSNDYIGQRAWSGRRGASSSSRPREGGLRPRGEHHRRQRAFTGATGGEAFIRRSGRRALLRAQLGHRRVVSRGVGDHACEYMTGGARGGLGLPRGGKPSAAGMSGGVAYVARRRREVFESRGNLSNGRAWTGTREGGGGRADAGEGRNDESSVTPS